MTPPSWSRLVAAGLLVQPCKARTIAIVTAEGHEAVVGTQYTTGCIGSTTSRTVATADVVGAVVHRSSCSLVIIIVKVIDRNTFAKKWEQKGKNK